MNNITNIKIACELLKGRIWEKGKDLGKYRVYFDAGYNTNKVKTNAYIDFDEELTESQFKDTDMNWFHGAKLVVWVDCKSQKKSWCWSEAKRNKAQIWSIIQDDLKARNVDAPDFIA